MAKDTSQFRPAVPRLNRCFSWLLPSALKFRSKSIGRWIISCDMRLCDEQYRDQSKPGASVVRGRDDKLPILARRGQQRRERHTRCAVAPWVPAPQPLKKEMQPNLDAKWSQNPSFGCISGNDSSGHSRYSSEHPQVISSWAGAGSGGAAFVSASRTSVLLRPQTVPTG